VAAIQVVRCTMAHRGPPAAPDKKKKAGNENRVGIKIVHFFKFS